MREPSGLPGPHAASAPPRRRAPRPRSEAKSTSSVDGSSAPPKLEPEALDPELLEPLDVPGFDGLPLAIGADELPEELEPFPCAACSVAERAWLLRAIP